LNNAISTPHKEPQSEGTPLQTVNSPPVVRLKFEMCKNWRERGICKYGDKCLFAHGEKELTKRQADPPKSATEPTKEECLQKPDTPAEKLSEQQSSIADKVSSFCAQV
jgi:retron-type reverse transcriptase